MNEITPFKDRVIDRTKPVKVYRNLNKPGVTYSVQQGGLIVAHAKRIDLRGVTFVVNEAGRQRVIKEKRKNVHAFVVGTVEHRESTTEYPARVSYNPYTGGQFYDRETLDSVVKAEAVHINNAGVTACLVEVA